MTANAEANANSCNAKDEIVDLIKGNGPWQITIFLVSLAFTIPLASHNLVMSFYAPNLDHWCSRPVEMNVTVEEWKSVALPPKDRNCFRYKFANFSDLTRIPVNQSRVETIPCDSWEYDDSVYISTVLSEWNLVCDKRWLVSLSKSIFIAGYFVSVMVFGYISDKYGRKPVIVLCNIISVISASICAFSTSFLMFAILRFFVAVGVSGAFNTVFVLIMEVVSPEYRTIYGMSINFGWCFGYVTLPLIAWLLRDWFWIQVVITLPCVCLLSAWWLLPESPRWLLSQGKLKEAEIILVRAGKRNGVHINDVEKKLREITLNKSKDEDAEGPRGNFFDLLRTSGLRQKTLNMFYQWCVIAFVYFGLTYNTNELAGDPFINFAASGAIEIPAYIIALFIIKYYGRRMPLSVSLIVGAMTCLLMYPLPQDPWWLSVAVSMMGKFFITISFGILYIYTVEIFPTVVRNVGMGSASVCGRVGSIVAPFVKELGTATHPVVPQLIFGILAAVGGVLVLFLPETNNCKIPDTLREAEIIKRNKTSLKEETQMMMQEMRKGEI